MNRDINQIRKKVDDIFDDIKNIRRIIHQNPELSEHEKNTSSLICDRLSELGIEYQSNIAGYGISAVIYGKDHERAIGIRADMDALPIYEKASVPFCSKNPGVMHACGHDIHTAILLGTAQILNEMKDDLPISVRLFFQPSEETIGGARQMIEAGCLTSPQVLGVIGLHVNPDVPYDSVEFTEGAMNAASCEFYVTVHGISCHGAHPTDGLDPLLPACEMVTALQTVITRKILATDSAIITVGQFHSGTKNNIIPPETKFSGIIRTLKNDQRQYIKDRVEEVCKGIASAHGATCTVDFREGYPALINDPSLFKIMTEASAEILGADKVVYHNVPSLGADDFSYFCQYSKGLYYNVGVAEKDQACAPPVHSDLFCPDEKSLKTGMLTEIYGTLKMMEALDKNDL